MNFLKILGRAGNSSYIQFQFEPHDPDTVNLGDQILSNGNKVEITEDITADDLDELISMVNNKQAFKGALLRMDFKYN